MTECFSQYVYKVIFTGHCASHSTATHTKTRHSPIHGNNKHNHALTQITPESSIFKRINHLRIFNGNQISTRRGLPTLSLFRISTSNVDLHHHSIYRFGCHLSSLRCTLLANTSSERWTLQLWSNPPDTSPPPLCDGLFHRALACRLHQQSTHQCQPVE